MSRLLTFFSLVVLTVSSAVAQNASFGKSDPAAKKVLDDVSARFKSYKSVKATFTLTIENAQGKVNGKKNGTVYMKGTKYRAAVAPQEMFCDGVNSWTYDKSSNEVKVDKVDASSSMITPQSLFTNFYDKNFLYKQNPDTKVNGKSAMEIELTPFDKSKPFFKVLVSVDKATKNILSVKVFDKNGSRVTYSINSFTPNSPAVTDDMFVFDQSKYPGVEVVDLR